jgi:hypothetical protein
MNESNKKRLMGPNKSGQYFKVSCAMLVKAGAASSTPVAESMQPVKYNEIKSKLSALTSN